MLYYEPCAETEVFFDWCATTLVTFEAQDCDESVHFYVEGVCIGGYDGCRRVYFQEQSDILAKLFRMYDAYNSIK